MDGQGKNLSGSIVKELMISLPADKKEQKLISSFFHNLDNLITLHQRELEKLKQLKQAMLQKMFV
jgi:type I restriction enzyme S subunit